MKGQSADPAANLIKGIGVALMFAAVLACGPPAGRLFHSTLAQSDGSYALPVTLGDTASVVVQIGPGPIDPSSSAPDAPSVRSDPADPNALIVTWSGSACVDETIVSMWQNDEGYGLMVASRGGPGIFGGCPAIALVRSLRIQTSVPVLAEQVSVIGSG